MGIPEGNIHHNPVNHIQRNYHIHFKGVDGITLVTKEVTWEDAAITAEALEQTEMFHVLKIIKSCYN